MFSVQRRALFQRLRRFASSNSGGDLLNVSTKGPVAILTVTRPDVLNALSSQVAEKLVSTAQELDAAPSIRVMIITGQGSKAFAAGADVKELADQSYSSAFSGELLDVWRDLDKVRKPVIAAVNGYALGGGCEVAMMCDIIVASTTARFGQPELKLGVIPGMGATQRLIRAVGKSKAMEMIIAGTHLSAEEAKAYGLVSRVVPDDQLMAEALQLANRIAQHSLPVVAKAKDCIKRSMELPLAEGLRYEQCALCLAFLLEFKRHSPPQKRIPTVSDFVASRVLLLLPDPADGVV